MVAIANHLGADHRNAVRARQLVDTALHTQRFLTGLSRAAPSPRAFVRAGACSLVLWSIVILMVASV